MRRVVSLWLPFWPTDRLHRHSCSGLSVETALVTRGHDGRRMVIAAADAAARALGLRAGMPLAHAQAMVPDLSIVDAAPSKDAEALLHLAAWCLRLSPLTAPDPPDGIWIDVTGCAHLHGSERAMLERLVAHLAGQRQTVRATIADTPGAAHAMARFGGEELSEVQPDAQADALASLPVAVTLPPVL